uniref:tRNA endonuclease ANKZF1 isoform X1 n=2 Tax=Pristiophorus japonicus TaxID=55135 RepID=UPI00398EE134
MAAVRSVFEAAGPARGLQLVEGPGLGLGLGHGQGQGRGEQAADLGPDTAGSDEVSGSTNEGRPLPEISDKMYCSACQCNFDRREDQTEHYKLDWHRFNLRQRLMGAQPVTAESFEKIAGEISSISGSDSEESGSDSEPERLQCRKIQNVVCLEGEDIPGEGQPRGRRGHRVIFRSEDGEYLSVYRCILQGKQDTREDEDEDTDSLLWSLHSLNPQTIWVVLMTGGGHFAGAVFRGSEPLQHKTFHRYTVRAKRGVAQGARDGQNRSRAPRSAGASLRRYNEAALVKDVEDLLANWSESLRVATAIFLRAPSYNRSIFFSGKDPPLSPSDARLRTIPFPTRRATFKEVKRVHAALSSMEIYARDTDIAMIHSPQRRVWKQKLRTEREGSGSERDGERDDCEAEAVNPADLPCSLEMVEESLGTLELKEFDVSPKKKRKKKKKKVYAEKTMGRGAPDTPEEGDDETTQTDCTKAADPGTRPLPTEERDQAKRRPKKIQTTLAGTSEEETERYRVRNELYTACKTGDLEHLRKLLCNVLLLGVTELGHSGQTESTNQAAESAVETDREQGSETDREQRSETCGRTEDPDESELGEERYTPGSHSAGPPGEGSHSAGPPGEGGSVSGPPGEGGSVSGLPGEGGSVSGPPGEGGSVSGPLGEGGPISGSPGEGGSVSGPPGEGGSVSGPPGEGGSVSGPQGEGGSVSGPPGEGGSVSGPLGEGGPVSGPVGEGGPVSGHPWEGGSVSGPPGEGGSVSGPPREGGSVSGPPGEGGSVSGPPGEGGSVSGLPGQGGSVSGPPGEGGSVSGPPGEGGSVSGPPGEGGSRPGLVTVAMLSATLDETGYTLLHVAAAAAQRAILRLLMDAGCDPSVRDKRGQSPYAVSADKQTRNEFRRYMADHPGRYDYTKAQISAPLTSEIESEKAEKKRAQKAAKKLREKEQKKQKQRLEEEEIERKRYSAMSEREKRALAAEKRFAQQLVNNGTSRDIRRCWLCGQALDRVPFEYLDYTFCTTHCLQEHRKQQRP